MRKSTLLTEAWFTKQSDESFAQQAETGGWDRVPLPHTWNTLDGQDGGSDYYRGECWYKIDLPIAAEGYLQYIQFEAANHVAKVWCNGAYVGEHRGGFSTFRFDITKHMKPENNQLTVSVENGDKNHVYPQFADFSFCGGLYRDVTFIQVKPAHIDLMQLGSDGVFITPTLVDDVGKIHAEVFVAGAAEDTLVRCLIIDAAGFVVAGSETQAKEKTVFEMEINSPFLWNGLENPYLYNAQVTVIDNKTAVDSVTVSFGFRDFNVDAKTGFHLNGASYPLRGVCRHQCRKNKGWAISKEDQLQDANLIKEIGANTIRLAHYQHSQYFHELCNQIGFVLWVEIPFISVFDTTPEARENTLSQMRELIAQNYNHPSVFFWGIANEITIAGESPEVLDNLRALDALVKEMDKTRLSTIANISIVKPESEHNQVTDILAYNLYFGWYTGSVDQNGPWFDDFHAKYPDRPLGLSEYGVECVLDWHSENPKVKDYSEEYQAYYHEEMLKIFATRPFLWGTYVWNMFDFAADQRDEGGRKGMNNKGLVTHDRAIKKDSFYVYKAAWSKEPFVHVAGRRFINRAGGKTRVKVYSNQPEVNLVINGQNFGSKSDGPVFIFDDVPLNPGENTITATAGKLCDMIIINGVEHDDPSYVLPQSDMEENNEAVKNWFESLNVQTDELRFKDGYYSIKDSMKDLRANPETEKIINEMMSVLFGAQQRASDENSSMRDMVNNMPLETLLQFAGDKVKPEVKIAINEKLQGIKKPE